MIREEAVVSRITSSAGSPVLQASGLGATIASTPPPLSSNRVRLRVLNV
jgi:hypothetical protein